MVTGVGDCGADCGTGATALTICRSSRGIPTGDSCIKGQIEANMLAACAYHHIHI